jgi:hypothetical protein
MTILNLGRHGKALWGGETANGERRPSLAEDERSRPIFGTTPRTR